MLDNEDLNNEEIENEASSTEEVVESEVTQEEDLQTQNAALKEQLLRTMAELENYRKRADREREDMAKFAITSFARDLLTVADNLRRALDSVPVDHEKPEELLNTLLEGVEITEKELLNAFKKHGIERIEPLAQPFDHHLHQAMFEVEDSDQPAGTVVHLMQVGYSLHGRLLRPAMVGVSK